jgi:hypothetical protein
LIAALHQDLIAEPCRDSQAEHSRVKPLGAREISNVETEMIEALKLLAINLAIRCLNGSREIGEK